MPDMNENAETQQEYFGITTQDDLKGCYYNRCKFCGYRPTCEMQKELVRKENAKLKVELVKKSDTNHTLVEQMADMEIENAELKAQIEKMKCCEICNHNKGGCSYHHNWTKDCLENNHKYFELKE